MPKNIAKKILPYSFWLSIFLHLLLLLAFSIVIIFPPAEEKKSPNLQVPSYVYTGKIAPSVQPIHASTANNSRMASQKETPMPQQKTQRSSKNGLLQKSMLAATREALMESQRNALNSMKQEEPIYLIGDENTPADPLIKLLGRALSAHFQYPRMAGEFGIKGRVIVGLTLHPDGHLSNVQMLRSSDNQDLDSAALYAVNTAPTVLGADRFISEPKHFVIGFVFQ